MQAGAAAPDLQRLAGRASVGRGSLARHRRQCGGGSRGSGAKCASIFRSNAARWNWNKPAMEPSWRRDVIEAVDPDQRLAAELEARCYSAAEVQDLEDRQRTFDDARKMPAIPDKEILLSLALRVAREIGSACAPVPVTVGMRSAFTACVVGMSCPTLLVRQTIEWWRCSKPSVDWVSASGTSSG